MKTNLNTECSLFLEDTSPRVTKLYICFCIDPITQLAKQTINKIYVIHVHNFGNLNELSRRCTF